MLYPGAEVTGNQRLRLLWIRPVNAYSSIWCQFTTLHSILLAKLTHLWPLRRKWCWSFWSPWSIPCGWYLAWATFCIRSDPHHGVRPQSTVSDSSVLVVLRQHHWKNAEMAKTQTWKCWASSFAFDLNGSWGHTTPCKIWPCISSYWLIFPDGLSRLSFFLYHFSKEDLPMISTLQRQTKAKAILLETKEEKLQMPFCLCFQCLQL